MLEDEAAEEPPSRGCEGHAHPPPVLGIRAAPHEPGPPAAVHEADRALVQDLETVRQVLHRRGSAAEAADEEKQLVLRGGHPGAAGRLLREAEEPAQGHPEARQALIADFLETGTLPLHF